MARKQILACDLCPNTEEIGTKQHSIRECSINLSFNIGEIDNLEGPSLDSFDACTECRESLRDSFLRTISQMPTRST